MREGIHRAGAAEAGLDFVEDEHDVVLAAKSLEELQIFGLRMKRTAAAEIGLGNQHADSRTDAAAIVRSVRLRNGVKSSGCGTAGRVDAFLARETDESNARRRARDLFRCRWWRRPDPFCHESRIAWRE